MLVNEMGICTAVQIQTLFISSGRKSLLDLAGRTLLDLKNINKDKLQEEDESEEEEEQSQQVGKVGKRINVVRSDTEDSSDNETGPKRPRLSLLDFNRNPPQVKNDRKRHLMK
jgi:hypothetical protein